MSYLSKHLPYAKQRHHFASPVKIYILWVFPFLQNRDDLIAHMYAYKVPHMVNVLPSILHTERHHKVSYFLRITIT